MQSVRRSSLAVAAALAFGWGCADAAPRNGNGTQAAQAAHAAAAEGYRLYAAGDYAAATEQARRAARLAPARRDYALLLAQALMAGGRADDAQRVLDQAARLPGDAAGLAPAYTALARLRALAAGDAMYRSLAAGDMQSAIRNGLHAVAHAPDHVPYRLLLAHALLRERRHDEADRFANEAAALRPDDPVPLALRGYARQGRARPTEAQADLERALARAGGAAAQRELRLAAADLALAQGDGARLLAILQPLPQDDAAAALRREMVGQPPQATAGFDLPAPGIDCSAAETTGSCLLHAADLPALPGYADASAGYAAMAEGDPARALAHARRAADAAPGHHRWRLLHMHAAQAAGDLAEAERAATAALEHDGMPDPGLLAMRSWMRRRLGDTSGAQADAEAALRIGGLTPAAEAALLLALGRHEQARTRLAQAGATARSPREHVDLAYLSIRAGDDAAAARAFAAADAAGVLPPQALRDAGYAAMRSHADAQSVAYLERAVAAAGTGELVLSRQQALETRRAAAEISRTWGVTGSVTRRNGGGVEPGFGAVGGDGGHRTTQAGVEGYWRPWGYRNGRYAEVFARGFATLDAHEGTWTGGDSFQGAAGARWKPLAAHNLVVSLARVFGPNVEDSWLAQAGYSLDLGSELRLDIPSWWTTRLAAEAGKYLDRGDSYGIASATFGRSFRVADDRTVLYPHLFIGAEHQSRDPVARTSSGAGVGLGVRRWLREDAGRGPRSYWDLTLQYRARLSGDERMKGVYASAQFSF